MNPIYHRAQFVLSAPSVRQLPRELAREVAFAGRSNSGKSSVLNVLTNQNRLARVSKTPGRTQLINAFAVTEDVALIDLPGYGFAKVNASMRAEWERTLPEYFRRREALRGIMLIMDIRHPLTEHDTRMLSFAAERGLPVHILLNKADKLNRGPAMAVQQKVARALAEYPAAVSVQLFSALKRQGIDEAHAVLDGWLFAPEQDEAAPPA
jgi:GTP-binding protein